MGGIKNLIIYSFGKLAILSPRIELFLRKIYWKNVGHLKTLRKKQNSNCNGLTDFNKVSVFLRTLLKKE